MPPLPCIRWSDVWFLVSLYYCSLRGKNRLRDVIGMADAINHSVMNFEEISSALVRLEKHRLISVDIMSWSVKCTAQGRRLVETLAKTNSLALRVWQALEKKLNVQPWVPGEPLPHPENNFRYPHFTNEVYVNEVAAYLATMQSR